LEARSDQPSLKLGGCAHDLSQESAVWVVGIVAADLAAFGRLEHPDVLASFPGVR
jgi:hypothetical protein